MASAQLRSNEKNVITQRKNNIPTLLSISPLWGGVGGGGASNPEDSAFGPLSQPLPIRDLWREEPENSPIIPTCRYPPSAFLRKKSFSLTENTVSKTSHDTSHIHAMLNKVWDERITKT